MSLKNLKLAFIRTFMLNPFNFFCSFSKCSLTRALCFDDDDDDDLKNYKGF